MYGTEEGVQAMHNFIKNTSNWDENDGLKEDRWSTKAVLTPTTLVQEKQP